MIPLVLTDPVDNQDNLTISFTQGMLYAEAVEHRLDGEHRACVRLGAKERSRLFDYLLERNALTDKTVATVLRDAHMKELLHELARRLSEADVSRVRAMRNNADASARFDRLVKDLGEGAVWATMPGGLFFWDTVRRTLQRCAAQFHSDRLREEKAGFLAPCPAGYGTVLGHMVQQGHEPEDMGMKEGIRLAKLAKEEGVAAIWVEASPALADICKRVRAYPAAFLERHLGPTHPDHRLVDGEVSEDARPYPDAA